jgi:antitoxin component of MazEF toxin-antitoxin module
MALQPKKPRLTAYRKITKDGNSLHVAPPVPFLHALGLLRGDLVELVLDETRRRFYVRPVKWRRGDRRDAGALLAPARGEP